MYLTYCLYSYSSTSCLAYTEQRFYWDTQCYDLFPIFPALLIFSRDYSCYKSNFNNCKRQHRTIIMLVNISTIIDSSHINSYKILDIFVYNYLRYIIRLLEYNSRWSMQSLANTNWWDICIPRIKRKSQLKFNCKWLSILFPDSEQISFNNYNICISIELELVEHVDL